MLTIDGYQFCVLNHFLFDALTAAICRLILKIYLIDSSLFSAAQALTVFALWDKVAQEEAQKHDKLIQEELNPGAYSLKLEVGVDVVIVTSAYSRKANKHNCVYDAKLSHYYPLVSFNQDAIQTEIYQHQKHCNTMKENSYPHELRVF